ncbi:hypothetical protein CBS101457_005326 [Exobasidium rhododendri]|nr:hypothetical protein CBS101457_005326 [Exobasidium rhododendri]
MAPTTVKRVKVSHTPATQPNLRDLFAKQSSSPPKGLTVTPREDAELEWAIQASLRESQSALPLQDARQNCVKADRKPEEQRQSKATSSCPKLDSKASRERDLKKEDNTSADRLVCAPPKEEEEGPDTGSKFNAFSRLMSSHSEAKEWAAADVVESRNYGNRSRQRKSAPFYKILTGMPICVDGFRFGDIPGCKAYFLSHFHADHYGGITSTWEAGPIYCSQTTANLVRTSLHVQQHLICPLPFDIPTTIPGTGGVQVTLLDANHCPGSSLFLFEGPQTCHILAPPAGCKTPALPPPTITFRYLHCGDFRASPRHTNHKFIKGKRLDIIYLDTTYCNPRYCFPAQEMVVNACAEMVRRAAPEQCRTNLVNMQEDDSDWRLSPLKGKRLKEAMEAEDNKPSVDAMKGWLESGIKSEFPVKEEEEEDLGDLDFKDEEAEFKADDQMGEDIEEVEDVRDCQEDMALVREPSSVVIKKEPDEEEDHFLLEEDPRAGLYMQSKAVKTEETDQKPREDETAQILSTVKDEQDAGLTCPEVPFPLPQKKKKEEEEADEKPRISRVLVVVGTYTIGKEKIVIACAKALHTKVYCADPRKYRVYAQLEDAELHSLLTRDPLKANVHVTSLQTINGDALKEHTAKMRSMGMQIDRAIAFRPTGWTYTPPAGHDLISPSLDRVIAWNQSRLFNWQKFNATRDSTKEYSIYGVPYSEHSSFFELTAFALSVDYVRIIATVNVGNPTSRNKMARWFEKWKAEKKRRNYTPVEPRSEDYF